MIDELALKIVTIYYFRDKLLIGIHLENCLEIYLQTTTEYYYIWSKNDIVLFLRK